MLSQEIFEIYNLLRLLLVAVSGTNHIVILSLYKSPIE